MALRIDLDDLDEIAGTHAPHLIAGPQPAGDWINGIGNAPNVPANRTMSLEAPNIGASPVPQMGSKAPSFNPGIARPDEAGSPGFFRQKIADIEKRRQTPWGSPDNHPGFLGKVAHGLATAGNIAGDLLAPGFTSMIPGSQLNMDVKEAEANRNLEKATAEQRASEEAKSKETLEGAQTEEAKARAAALGEQKPVKAEPIFDKAGNVIGFRDEGGDLLGPNSPKLTQDMKDMLKASQPKPEKPSGAEDDAKYEAIIQKQKLKQPVTPEEKAFAEAYEKRKTLVPAANVTLNAPKVATARSDKSYEYNSKQLDGLATPIDQITGRMGRLIDTMNQKNPQADALVAPELLTVMAGGMGSGLRMNEAEIARIVGGRSAWENLKASIQHWKTNPDDARSITPDQDRQIRALIDTVHKKLTQKQAIIDEARNNLLDSDDPKEHRKILADTKKKLDAVDAGQVEGGGTEPPRPPREGMKWQRNKTTGEFREVPVG